MKRQRLLIILGVLLLLAIVLTFINLSRGNDGSRTQLDDVFNNNTQIVALSQLAAKDASNYSLQVVASSLAATTASDSQQLTVYYKSRYGKGPKKVSPPKESNPTIDLEETEAGSGFDATYKESARQFLEANIALFQTLYDQTEREQLRELLETMYHNQATGLEQINTLP